MAIIDSLVSYWKLDDNAANTTVADADGSNTGTSSTNTDNLSVGGKINTAFDFEAGSSQYVGYGQPADLDFSGTDSFSISAWIKIESLTADGTIFSKWSGTSPNFQYLFKFESSNNKLRMILYDGGGFPFAETTAAVTTATWYHVVATISSSAIKLYLNAVDQQSDTYTTNASIAKDIFMGKREGGTSLEYFDGIIDEVGVWAKVLSQAEITSLYNSGAGLAYPFSAGGTNSKINIGDAWKDINKLQINIGDSWKEVTAMKINIGDSWKDIF